MILNYINNKNKYVLITYTIVNHGNLCNINITVIFTLHDTIDFMGLRKLKNAIGKKIKSLRLDKNLSQEKLAECVNMSREHISCIERGKHLPTIETLYNMAKFFEIDIKNFF